FPVGVVEPPLLTNALSVTGCPNWAGLALDDKTVLLLFWKLISSTGCSSMPLGAMPVCPCSKSKKATPFTWTGMLAVWKLGVAVRRASNFARAPAIPGPRGLGTSMRPGPFGLGARMQAGLG